MSSRRPERRGGRPLRVLLLAAVLALPACAGGDDEVGAGNDGPAFGAPEGGGGARAPGGGARAPGGDARPGGEAGGSADSGDGQGSTPTTAGGPGGRDPSAGTAGNGRPDGARRGGDDVPPLPGGVVPEPHEVPDKPRDGRTSRPGGSQGGGAGGGSSGGGGDVSASRARPERPPADGRMSSVPPVGGGTPGPVFRELLNELFARLYRADAMSRTAEEVDRADDMVSLGKGLLPAVEGDSAYFWTVQGDDADTAVLVRRSITSSRAGTTVLATSTFAAPLSVNAGRVVVAMDVADPARATRSGQGTGGRSKGDTELHLIAPGAKAPMRLTHDTATEGYPAWSPDGKRIAFASDADGDFDIYVMSADGGKPTRLTNSPATESFPTWSPDGRHLAFASDAGGDYEINVMRADGRDVRRLTDNDADDVLPTWSQRGITFSAARGDDYDLVTVGGPDGRDEAKGKRRARVVTEGEDHELYPMSTPDGRRTVFARAPVEPKR